MLHNLHHLARPCRLGLAVALRRLAFCFLLAALLWPHNSFAQEAANDAAAVLAAPPLINVPYTANSDPAKGAIFWLGQVSPASNYADVRMVYTNDGLAIVLHIFDQRTTYDENAAAGSDLTQWDAVSLYVDTQSDLAAPLQSGVTLRIDNQLNHWQARTNYVRTFRWQNSAWQAAGLNLPTEAGFRGFPNDAEDDRGWLTSITLPFAELGLPNPAKGATWRMALVLHDRDAVGASPLPDQTWPLQVALDQPATWGRIRFGVPTYTPAQASASRQITMRHGVDGIQAPDAAVGGHSECGAQFAPNFFDRWGDAKYPGYAQFNIQNQWDVADWPCFSKYYVTFPLDALPATANIISATLTMYMFGNAGYNPGDAKPSFIQAARVGADWSEQTLTWNNAPPVLENYSWAIVEPMKEGDPAAKPATWDMARAVADALAAREPLRLVFYSSDGDYHSGKYFWSADAGEDKRPVLNITWANQSYQVSATPIRAAIRSGESARYELTVASLAEGESVTLQVGPSSPTGLDIVVTPKTVTAPGGKVLVTLTDRSKNDAAVLYSIPVQFSNGVVTQSTKLTVLVNGQLLFLPAIVR